MADTQFPNRIRIAAREDVNIIVVAGSVALSLAFLTPVPALVTFVAEAVYLMYVPDTRWYGLRILRRMERDALRRRNKLRGERFPLKDVPLSIGQLEGYRATVSRQKATDNAEWVDFLRTIDRLIEQQIIVQSDAVRVAESVAPLENRELTIRQRIDEHHKSLGYYETTRQVLEQTIRDLSDVGTQQEFVKNLAQVKEREAELQHELFQIVTAEQLITGTNDITERTIRFLAGVAEETGTESLPTWRNEAAQLLQESERMTERLLSHLAQGRGRAF